MVDDLVGVESRQLDEQGFPKAEVGGSSPSGVANKINELLAYKQFVFGSIQHRSSTGAPEAALSR